MVNEQEVQEGLQIAQLLAPFVQETVDFFRNLFAKHAPAATPEQVSIAATQAIVPLLNTVTAAGGVDSSAATALHVAQAVAVAIANPTPAPVPVPVQAPTVRGGVHFNGSTPVQVG